MRLSNSICKRAFTAKAWRTALASSRFDRRCFGSISSLESHIAKQIVNNKVGIDYWIEELANPKKEISLKTSLIRELDIGYNFFKFIDPKRKKLLLTLLNTYLRILEEKSISVKYFSQALNFYYNNQVSNVDFGYLLGKSDFFEVTSLFNEEILNHIFSITVFERLATSFSRVDYIDYHKIIRELSKIPKEKRNRCKFVYTSHPTIPNSMEQIITMQDVCKGLEENDMEYLHYSLGRYIDATFNRDFKRPTFMEESNVYHSMAIPNLINAFSFAYELGFKDPQDFYESFGSWISFDFDNHKDMSVGVMTHTHGLMIELTITCYVKILLEAQILDISEVEEVLKLFESIVQYSKEIREKSELVRNRQISSQEFYDSIPRINLYSLEEQITSKLDDIQRNKLYSVKATYTAEKMLKLIQVFKLTGFLGEIKISGDDVIDFKNIKRSTHDIFKEISILNANCLAADLVIIANYISSGQYRNVQALIKKYQVGHIEVVPLLESFSSTNDTDSNITMITSSDTRKRDLLVMTELRILQEYKNHPEKAIYVSQGITAERGGGPFNLKHQKYLALTESQRRRHLCTIQGFQFATELISKDLAFVHIMNGCYYINQGESFNPTDEYIEFLFNLDSNVGLPTSLMQKTEEFNNLYVKNPYIKTLVDLYDYAGSDIRGNRLEDIRKTRAIVQAYINSDRCSYCHPELANWDKMSTDNINNIIKFYYDNTKHLLYILYHLGFIVRRCDLEMAMNYSMMDVNNKYFKSYIRGKEALEKLLNHLAIGKDSTPITGIYKQHIGISHKSSLAELAMKENAYKNVFKLQKNFIDLYLANGDIANTARAERSIKILQTTLSNFSQFNGKG